MKKIAIVVASKNFRDEEYFIPLNVFIKEGFNARVFSDKKGNILGINGGEGFAQEEIDNFSAENFLAVVFIGGEGAIKYLDNEKSYQLINKAIKKEIVIAAICISPIILAKAGALKNTKATVWSSSMEKGPVRLLEKYGAVYQKEKIVNDKGVITGSGPDVAESFAREVIEEIKKRS